MPQWSVIKTYLLGLASTTSPSSQIISMIWQDYLLAKQQKRRDLNLWRERHEVRSAQSVQINRNGKIFLNFSSNDYLGLAADPRLAEASNAGAKEWGTGSGASHLVSGHQTPHHLLEQELAEFVEAEDALLFSTGYMANLALPSAFLKRGDLILQDKLNHASLVDSGMLCQAAFKRYAHGNLSAARKILSSSTAKMKMLSVDSVFSMDGDMADLPKLTKLTKQHDCLLVVDEAHGFGVLGETGAGALEHFGLRPTDNILMMGTLGKALGSFGAFVAGDKVYIDELKQAARTYIYTTALPATAVEATREALKIVKTERWRRRHLLELVHQFREAALEAGIPIMESKTPIQPIVLGKESAALDISEKLETQNIWAPAIRPPTVPKSTSRLRVCFSTSHSFRNIDQLVKALTLFCIEK